MTSPLPKSTVARLLLVLGGRGYVWREPARPRYRLGHRGLELTANALRELAVVGHGRPHLYDLAGRTARVACLGVLWDVAVVVVDIVEPPAAAPAALAHEPLEVGRALTHASSIGKAIVAHRPSADIERFVGGRRWRGARRARSPTRTRCARTSPPCASGAGR